MTHRAFASCLFALLVLDVALLAGCKEKENAATSATTIVAAAKAGATPAPAASATAAAPVNKAAVKGAPQANKAAKKDKGVLLSIWDTSTPPDVVESCGDGDIVIVLPEFLDAAPWKVKADKGLGTPKEELREGWRGPNSNSTAFVWNALKAAPGQYVATFTSGKDVVKVEIKVDPGHIPCE